MIASVVNRPPKVLHSGMLQLGSLRVHHMHGGRGTPVLFIHGLGSSGYMEWRFNLESAAGRHRVYAPDLPGFGRSEKPRARYSVPYFTRFIERYMDDRGLRSAAVVGASLGGRIALELALKHPKRVRKLVLVNALGLGRPNMQLSYGLMTLPRVGEAVMKFAGDALRWAPKPMIRRVAARYVGARGNLKRHMDDDYFANLRELYAAEGYPGAYLTTIRSLITPKAVMAADHDLSDRLGEIKVPVQLIWGANDPLFPVVHAARAHGLIPGSRLAVMEGAGHTPQAERPEEFNHVLDSFLAS
ncbi:MAG: alpha/beta fold hydrolase [Candidatus Dormibacteraeota bacterium]|nr:alpha/beta fold hydrolase [Candidatus Dormibacteraeota bacterium]